MEIITFRSGARWVVCGGWRTTVTGKMKNMERRGDLVVFWVVAVWGWQGVDGCGFYLVGTEERSMLLLSSNGENSKGQ
ncbi:hypothetical protein HAX54_053215 [Datura stramonium]|uniref:Uncharacterized protein n=1 Tax=Datura stramonium TaxID=4076 RepID=A0ABS8T021_DATST|nr:hypothetical protein [Datura stramonium]